MAKSETKAKDVHGDALEETRSRVTLTKEQRADVFRAAKGKCFCCGGDVDPLETFSIVEGKLLDEGCNKLRGGRSLDELRAHLVNELDGANALIARLGHLRSKGGDVLFAGDDRQAVLPTDVAEHLQSVRETAAAAR